jgi:hypothetical protein
VVLLTCVQDGMATVADGNGGIFTRLASRKVRRPAREYRAWRWSMRRSGTHASESSWYILVLVCTQGGVTIEELLQQMEKALHASATKVSEGVCGEEQAGSKPGALPILNATHERAVCLSQPLEGQPVPRSRSWMGLRCSPQAQLNYIFENFCE